MNEYTYLARFKENKTVNKGSIETANNSGAHTAATKMLHSYRHRQAKSLHYSQL